MTKLKATIKLIERERIIPHPQHPRRFFDATKAERLISAYKENKPIDPLLVRIKDNDTVELLGGLRRLFAAEQAGCHEVPCRIENVDDEEAFRLLMRDNDNDELSTLERCAFAAEMHRLGFSRADVAYELGDNVQAERYIAVGYALEGLTFTNTPKLCDPSITLWYDLLKFGLPRFRYCFHKWEQGEWTSEQCAFHFRRASTTLPLDNAEKGIRITISKGGQKLAVRGTLDLDIHNAVEIVIMLDETIEALCRMRTNFENLGCFGVPETILLNPDTLVSRE